HAGVYLEREDPIHRGYEFRVRGNKIKRYMRSAMSYNFATWAEGVYDGTITAPFFMRLETTTLCLGDDRPGKGELLNRLNDSISVVEYTDAQAEDTTKLPDNIFILSFDNSVVKAVSISGLGATIENEDAWGETDDLEQTFDTSNILRSKV